MLGTQELSCAIALARRSGHTPRMEDAAVAGKIRAWLNQVMQETGLSVTAWAERAGVARTTIARPLKDDYAFVTSSRTLAKLAKAAGREPPSIQGPSTDPRLSPVAPHFLEVRYKAQAGYWIENEGFVHQHLEPPRPVAPDPAYEGWGQWLELVVGDSVDKMIPDGGYAHVVDAIEMGYAPRPGDLVVVERRRNSGQLRERSIKQVRLGERGVELWPISHNPLWASPLLVSGGDEDHTEVEIVGLVIGAYHSFRR